MTLIKGRDHAGDLKIDADAVVVGTGAGGSVIARELARAGLSVVALEEGGFHTPSDFNQREDEMLPLLFQEGGGRSTKDLAIRVLQGRGVGGSTVHNTNLCKRIPDQILEQWSHTHRVSNVAPDDLRPSFEQIERELSVGEMPKSIVSRNNDVLERGVARLGWKGGPLKHNRRGCQGSGFCELGCVYDAKENALKVMIPDAIKRGATVVSDARVTRVTHQSGRVNGIEGVLTTKEGHPKGELRIRANVVVLAASAVGSAYLALRSDLPNPHRVTGSGLRMHPGGIAAGIFDEEIAAHRGIPQSYECTELLSFDEGSEKRIWIVPAFAHPIGTAAIMPGFGPAHMASMRDYTKIAVLTAMLHDETSGFVLAEDRGPRLDYQMIEADRAALARGLVASAKLLFAAGAKRVVIPAMRPVHLTSEKELEQLDTSFVAPHSVPLSAVHPMGTMRMGDDPRTSAVSSQGEHHQMRGLFVCDGSLFPTSIGGPPQIGIYSFALHLSPHVIGRARA